MSNLNLSLDNHSVSDRMITLIGKDESVHQIDLISAQRSQLFKTILETDLQTEEIPLNLSAPFIEWSIEYLVHYKNKEPTIIQKPLRCKDLKELLHFNPPEISEWDLLYLQKIAKDKALFYEFINASNYLDIKSLVELCCAHIAAIVKSTPLDKLEETLKVK